VTFRAWLREQSPAPPPRLAARIDEILDTALDADLSAAPASCLTSAEALLRDVLSRPSAGRDVALDLLTVDALVTYAFELLSANLPALDDMATSMMQRFAATARG
jgi:hypothetical protein